MSAILILLIADSTSVKRKWCIDFCCTWIFTVYFYLIFCFVFLFLFYIIIIIIIIKINTLNSYHKNIRFIKWKLKKSKIKLQNCWSSIYNNVKILWMKNGTNKVFNKWKISGKSLTLQLFRFGENHNNITVTDYHHRHLNHKFNMLCRNSNLLHFIFKLRSSSFSDLPRKRVWNVHKKVSTWV